ncbi:hypothetical protein EYF80_055056 [Liparis tanakae]|uniref:Uncharacterized protein n=1 Tax=Liparis tanakae TaxID=230148 RepID=A0A4Z2F265_9TELE|nr:hypothetical protein EYF80_055056 [Liparis tanakae]
MNQRDTSRVHMPGYWAMSWPTAGAFAFTSSPRTSRSVFRPIMAGWSLDHLIDLRLRTVTYSSIIAFVPAPGLEARGHAVRVPVTSSL